MRHQLTANSKQQTESAVSKDQPAITRGTNVYSFRFKVSGLLCFALFLFGAPGTKAQTCPDPAPQTSGSHSFRQQGESFDIPISVADCQPLALELRWSNGRNNGSNFHVTFLDSDNQAIYTKEISGFLTGSFQFPFATLEPRPSLGSLSLISVPVKVTIEAVRPFAFPATISYRVTRVATHPPAVENREAGTGNREATTVNGGKTENMKAELVESTAGKSKSQ
jgi:hypothetical protein